MQLCSIPLTKHKIMMSSAVIIVIQAHINPNEPEALKHYLDKSAPLFKAAGATVLANYKIDRSLVGNSPTNVVKIMEFPSLSTLETVFDSNAYQALLPFREKAFLNLNIYISKQDQ